MFILKAVSRVGAALQRTLASVAAYAFVHEGLTARKRRPFEAQGGQPPHSTRGLIFGYWSLRDERFRFLGKSLRRDKFLNKNSVSQIEFRAAKILRLVSGNAVRCGP